MNLLTITDAPRGWKQASLHLANGQVLHFAGRTTHQAREAAYLWIIREIGVLEPLREL